MSYLWRNVCVLRENSFVGGQICAVLQSVNWRGGGRDNVLKDGTSRQLLKNMMPWLGHNGTWRPTI